jgi:peptide deformylase
MAIRQILFIGDEALRLRAKEVTEFDSRLGQLLDDMKETMLKANGVGLAAPQVGILKRAFVVSIDGTEFFELVNPVIAKKSGVQYGTEGCLSVPGRSGTVERPKKLTVNAFNRYGERIQLKVSGYTAVAFCHEIDHLDGVLFVDKLIEETPPGR